MLLDDYKEQLKNFISFKSISTDPAFAHEIKKTAQWLTELFKQHGFEVELWEGGEANPVVFSQYTMDPTFETVLVYGHYDVQPASMEQGWKSEPFEVTERDGRLYARGIVDNKGQVLIHIVTVLDLIKRGKLKCNVKFLIEGNEETSNPELGEFIEKNKNKLKCDHIIISDGEILGEHPVVEYSLRGGFNCKLTYKTAQNNLHSGIYGGVVPNAAIELNKFVANLFDQNYQLQIPNFYADVDIIPEEIKQNNSKLSTKEEFIKSAGVKKLILQDELDVFSQLGLQPTVSVTGFKSGYIDEGYSNIVPNTAEVRLNFRTVSSQSYEKIMEQFKRYVAENTADYVEYALEFSAPYDPVKINIESPKIVQVKAMLAQTFGTETLAKPVGGGIPVVSDFKTHLGIDTLLISLGNEDCNMHGVDENFRIDIIEKGLKFSEMFFSTMPENS